MEIIERFKHTNVQQMSAAYKILTKTEIITTTLLLMFVQYFTLLCRRHHFTLFTTSQPVKQPSNPSNDCLTTDKTMALTA